MFFKVSDVIGVGRLQEAFKNDLKKLTNTRECFAEEISLQGTSSRGPELFFANFRCA